MPRTSGWIGGLAWTGVLAFLLTILTGGIWTGLLVTNLAKTPTIPWSVFVMALVLWAIWAFFGGRWGPVSTRETRRNYMRARRVPRRILLWSLAAGGLSIASLTGLWIVLFRLVKIPGNAVPDLSQYSKLTLVSVLVMASLMSSVAEEVGYRGYFQRPLESQFTGPAAILISVLWIAPAHGLTQGFLWPTVLFYFAVDTMLGTMAYLTKSIVPGVIVHSIGLLVFFTFIWPQDQRRELIWVSGADGWFWVRVAQAVLFAALGIMAFIHLARLTGHRAQ